MLFSLHDYRCTEKVPNTGEEVVIVVKEVKNKSKSSGKFYSVRSFLFGFYNNVLGMVGFVRTRKYAKKNWQERQEYEENLKILTAKKREERLAREAAAAAEQQQQTVVASTVSTSSTSGLKP